MVGTLRAASANISPVFLLGRCTQRPYWQSENVTTLSEAW